MNGFQYPDEYDITVFGAGVVGLLVSALLIKHGLRVALVDKGDIEPAESAPAGRALAITPASRQLLEQIGAWSVLTKEVIGPVRKMQIDDRSAQAQLEFDCATTHQPALAYIVEDHEITRAVFQVLRSSHGLTLYPRASAHDLVCSDKAILSLEDGRNIRSGLLIGADGQSSWVRKISGIGQEQHQYDQHAVVCVIKSQATHGQIARQIFFQHGILALLPMAPRHQTAIVWSTHSQHADHLCALTEDVFIEQLQAATQNVLGDIQYCSARHAFPLQAAQAEHYIADRVALIGDAAHSVHPLAGQGANLGFLDAAALAQVVLQAQTKKKDFGTHHVLRQYERWRQGDNRIMMQAFTGLKEIYEQDVYPLPVIRGLGMNMLNRIAPAKRWLMMRAMGLSGDIPDMIKQP